ncbi:MAG TPA: NUDIX domain-containing protein [Anaerolineaceae bacterium]|nr:NUDIX domain-containing protein [Anaerolineaceae bacterium]
MKAKNKLANISSIEELEKWLSDQKIELHLWNCGNAKSLENLFNEIIEGDCSIQLNPPMRIINAVQVLIFRSQSLLVELEQEMIDDRTRKRNLPPSEKMKPGEDCKEAAIRCLVEELQLSQDEIKILTEECKPFIRYRKSRSYPGLKTKYYVYRVQAQVDQLPEGNFWSKEKESEEHADIVRRHYWGWSPSKNIKYPD